MQAAVPPVATGESGKRRVGELFRAHSDFVWRCLLRLGVGPAAAQDALQEVFLIAYRRIDSLSDMASPRAWLFTIARRTASHHRRAHQRLRHHLETIARTPPRAPDPELELRRKWAQDLVQAFLSDLDEGRREVFVLHELEGFSGREIAETLGVNHNTVHTRLRAARRAFADWLAERGIET